MTVRALVPWRVRRRGLPVHRFDRMFDEFFNEFNRAEMRPFEPAFSPLMDVSETDTEIKVVVELPGMDEQDIDVSLERNVLTIGGEKKAENRDEGENFYHVERTCGAFKRSVVLPAGVETGKVEATYKNGVLTIVLPKTAAAQARHIEVKAS